MIYVKCVVPLRGQPVLKPRYSVQYNQAFGTVNGLLGGRSSHCLQAAHHGRGAPVNC